MYLKHLSLTNFRNFVRLDVDVPAGALVLVGGNAQGKTSLLEAIYYLATLTSFNASNDRELLNFLAARDSLAVARIVADFVRHDVHGPQAGDSHETHRLEVRIIHEGAAAFNGTPRVRREVLLDGVKRKLSEAIGAFNAVLFLPQMMRVVEGPPEERRRYLNLAIAQAKPEYVSALTQYGKLITQRNALLKQLAERGGDPSQLLYWDQRLTAAGAQIIYARIQTIRQLERHATRIHSELTRGQEILRLDYQPGFEPMPQSPLQYALPMETPVDRSNLTLESIQKGFLKDLEKRRSEEIARGVTTIGPHRDEMRLLANGYDLGMFGSRGQGRTAMLSMKLAEVAWLKESTGQMPVLLLDEVLAELDPNRREDLLNRLAASEQSLLTTTDLDLFTEDFLESASQWVITAGMVESAET